MKIKNPYESIKKTLVYTLAFLVLYTAAFGTLPHMQQRALVVFLGLAITFLTKPGIREKQPRKSKVPWYDLIFIGLTGVACFNIAFRYKYYMSHYFAVDGNFEYIIGIIFLILILEATRRGVGKVFILLNLGIIIYTLLGHYITGYWGHGYISYQHFLQLLYQSDLGMWGMVTGIVAALITIFILFGAFLQYTGGAKTFLDLSVTIAGKYKGGPAMVAVIASAFFGTFSGSALANVATTGTFTIPLMKRLGYKPEFAGGVEAAASTGGQLMPPMMGTAAFIMAELIGISYFAVCVAAFIPALLYFGSILLLVYLRAIKHNLSPMSKSEIPSIKEVLKIKNLAPLLLPIAVLIFYLYKGYDPYRACFNALFVALILYIFSNFNNFKLKLLNMNLAIEKGIESIVNIIPLLVSAQILVSLINMSGLGNKFSVLIMRLSGENMLLSLVIGAIIATILGMSLPTTPAYLVAVTTVIPCFYLLKIDPLSTHLFVFYFAIISSITPPVCTAVYTAATIADSDWIKTAIEAMKLAILSYFVPFFFIYNPAILLKGSFSTLVINIVSLGPTIFFTTISVGGYFRKYKIDNIIIRILMFTIGILFLFQDLKIKLIALLIGLLILLYMYIYVQYFKRSVK